LIAKCLGNGEKIAETGISPGIYRKDRAKKSCPYWS
jgi:hypothetical protein